MTEAQIERLLGLLERITIALEKTAPKTDEERKATALAKQREYAQGWVPGDDPSRKPIA